jgi:hypothetical protein
VLAAFTQPLSAAVHVYAASPAITSKPSTTSTMFDDPNVSSCSIMEKPSLK